jgi:hypothetical protein
MDVFGIHTQYNQNTAAWAPGGPVRLRVTKGSSIALSAKRETPSGSGRIKWAAPTTSVK